MRLFMFSRRRVESKQRALAGVPVPARKRGPVIEAAGAALAAIVLSSIASPPAGAQAGVTASVASEYSARGRSLSKGRLAPQLRLDYDAPAGWYAGALLSRAALPYSDTRAQLIAYGGFAQTLPSGLTWEAGALDASFVDDEEYHYHEFYAGLTRDRVSGRVYYSPSYYGGGKTLYAELNASYPLHDRISLIAHLGLLHPLGAVEGESRQRLDLRLGFGFEAGDWNLQVALLASAPRRHGPDAPRALALSATYGF
jgi:uncharacterized protein (TIGR02001 family)